MNQDKFSIKEALSFGWDKTRANIKFLLILFVFHLALYLPFYFLDFFLAKQESMTASIISLLLAFIYNLAYFVISIAMIAIFLGISRGEKPIFLSFLKSLKLFFTDWKLLFNYVLTSALYSLIVMAGILLLIIPGVVWFVKYSQWMYLVIDKRMTPLEALKKSGQITQGSKKKIFLLWLSLALVVIVGFLPGILTLGFGFIFMSLMIGIASASVYLKLTEPSGTPEVLNQDLNPETPNL